MLTTCFFKEKTHHSLVETCLTKLRKDSFNVCQKKYGGYLEVSCWHLSRWTIIFSTRGFLWFCDFTISQLFPFKNSQCLEKGSVFKYMLHTKAKWVTVWQVIVHESSWHFVCIILKVKICILNQWHKISEKCLNLAQLSKSMLGCQIHFLDFKSLALSA